MSRNKFESIDEPEDDESAEQEESIDPPAPAKPLPPLPRTGRNLTWERVRAKLESDLAIELDRCGADETIDLQLPKLDSKGEKVRDSSGYVVIEKRTVLKRDHIEKTGREKIEKMCSKLERNAAVQ